LFTGERLVLMSAASPGAPSWHRTWAPPAAIQSAAAQRTSTRWSAEVASVSTGAQDPRVILYVVVLYFLAIFALFWVIRLAVRYGVDDALRKNRSWLDRRVADRPSAE